MTTVDDILIEIGEFGRYQKRLYPLLVLTALFSIPFMMLSVFILAVPDHRCKIPNLHDDLYEIEDEPYKENLLMHIPKSEDGTSYDKCKFYDFNDTNIYINNTGAPTNFTLTTCKSWVYSTKVFTTTFAAEHNLVCGDAEKTSIIKMIFFAGVLAGSLGFGVLSDVIGRRKTLLLATYLLFGFSLALSWAPNIYTFMILRFCIGFCNVGMFMTGFVILMEYVGPNKRCLVAVVSDIIATIGQLYLVIVSYLLGKWNWTIVGVSIPIGLLAFSFWFLPESPRWLLSQGKLEETKKQLEKVAKVNGKGFPSEMMTKLTKSDKSDTGKLWLLFTDRVLLLRTLIIFYMWMVASMMYYGLSLNAGKLYGGYYLNIVISVLVEFPGHGIPLLVINRYGRRTMLSLFWIIGGIACVCTIFTVTFGGEDEGRNILPLLGTIAHLAGIVILHANTYCVIGPWISLSNPKDRSAVRIRTHKPMSIGGLQSLTTALAMIGKFFASACFTTVYIYSAELFPTVVRNAGMGGSSASSRIGGMISPFIADSASLVDGKFGKALPLVIFGSASIVAGLLCMLLPETLNSKFPESIIEVKNMGRKQPSDQQPTNAVHPATEMKQV